MELEFEMNEESGFCFTSCPFISSDVKINSLACDYCDYNYGLNESGKLLCKGDSIGKI